MKLGGLQKATLVDYPGKVAATVFTQGCTFRCPFCHNPELVLPGQFAAPLAEEEFFSFLASRQGKLEAVCITGGEPTIHADLGPFMRRIKELGFLVKLDSNGSRPEVLARLLAEGAVDYVAMDIKAPAEKYAQVAGVAERVASTALRSIGLIMRSGVEYEFRTTVMKPLLAVDDFAAIGSMIKGARLYCLQNYVAAKQVSEAAFEPFTPAELEAAREAVRPYVQHVEIR